MKKQITILKKRKQFLKVKIDLRSNYDIKKKKVKNTVSQKKIAKENFRESKKTADAKKNNEASRFQKNDINFWNTLKKLYTKNNKHLDQVKKRRCLVN